MTIFPGNVVPHNLVVEGAIDCVPAAAGHMEATL